MYPQYIVKLVKYPIVCHSQVMIARKQELKLLQGRQQVTERAYNTARQLLALCTVQVHDGSIWS